METYKIKQVPEDFFVREIPLSPPCEKGGRYSYFVMRKKDYTTVSAIRAVSDKAGINAKDISFAGTKDRRAVTEQLISVRDYYEKRIKGVKLKGIEVSFYGRGDERIKLGDLKGNAFRITARNLSKKPLRESRFVNFFGEQRFSSNNEHIGKALLKKDFKKAIWLILQQNGRAERKAEELLERAPNDFVGAIRAMPKEIGIMYVHAYQSLLWNMAAGAIAKKEKSQCPVPIIGFGTNLQGYKHAGIIKAILDREKITQREFIIKQIPRFSFEGGERNLYAEINELSIGHLEPDELNPGMKKCLLSFWLGKGSYATVAIKSIIPGYAGEPL